MADIKPLHDGRGIRTDRQGGDRSHPQHNHKSRLIMPSGHPENYTSLTDVTQRGQLLAFSAAPCAGAGGPLSDFSRYRLSRHAQRSPPRGHQLLQAAKGWLGKRQAPSPQQPCTDRGACAPLGVAIADLVDAFRPMGEDDAIAQDADLQQVQSNAAKSGSPRQPRGRAQMRWKEQSSLHRRVEEAAP